MLRTALLLLLASAVVAVDYWAPVTPYRPALRDEVSLNGTWNFTTQDGRTGTIPVPEYWDNHFANTTVGTYERQVAVPAAWTGKRVCFDFEGVAHAADVYINGVAIGSHTGAWTPFRLDATGYAVPGATCTLRVVVRGGNQPGLANAAGVCLWPSAWWGHQGRWGIPHEVWLRAYGEVGITDSFIRTAFAAQRIDVDWTVRNASASSRTVTVRGTITDAAGDAAGPTLTSTAITLAANETRTITVSGAWTTAHPWFPDDPYLYRLHSEVVEASAVEDYETRRFGFREVTVSGNQVLLNAIPMRLTGDSSGMCSQGALGWRYEHLWPETTWSGNSFPITLGRMKNLNLRVLRLHQVPAPSWMLDLCDQQGMLVIAESAIYAREYHQTLGAADKAAFIANSKLWLPDWIRGSRNHPAIVMWSAENEMGVGWINWMTPAEIKSLGDVVSALDPTRPVDYDGDQEVGGQLLNYHYPEGHTNEPVGLPASWATMASATKPSGIGEYITDYTPDYASANVRNRWWQGTWTRGLRRLSFWDLRPYSLEWTWMAGGDAAQMDNITRSFAPVTAFDTAYDDLGIDPLTGGSLPTLDEGATVGRDLVLFNDEWHGTGMQVTTEVRVNGTLIASGTAACTVPLGERRNVHASFHAPWTSGDTTLDWVLRVTKGGVQRSQETYHFRLHDLGTSGTVDAVVGLSGNALDSGTIAPAITTQPANQTVTAPATATFSVVATGIPAPTYQWRKGGVAITGATSASYTTPATSTADNGALFSVVVTNSAGSATSANATLTVNAATVAPAITTQPANLTVTAPATATFTVVATGTPAPTYQWRKGGAAITGATSASYTTPVTTTADNGALFSVVVTNSTGSATSANATLTVTAVDQPPPAGSTPPVATGDGAGHGCGGGSGLVALLAGLGLMFARRGRS